MQFRTWSLTQLKIQEDNISVVDESVGTNHATSEKRNKWHLGVYERNRPSQSYRTKIECHMHM